MGDDTRGFLATARSLGRQGIESVVLENIPKTGWATAGIVVSGKELAVELNHATIFE